MTRIIVAIAAILASMGTAHGQSGCIYPQPPQAIPDGSKATYEEMVEGHKAVRQFDSDVRTYTVCLELELKAQLENPSIDETSRRGLQELWISRNNAAIDQAQAVVERFNEQLRIFRARDQKEKQGS